MSDNSSNTLNLNSVGKVIARKTANDNINMPVPFLKKSGSSPQNLLIDTPDELYYNPSTKTLHADNFSGGIPSLIEGEAIQLTTSNNSTEIDVNFSKNTEAITTFDNADTFLASNSSNALKTITGLNLSNQLRAGLCPLNSNNIIPNQYLPGSVSDILEVANFASLPTTGDSSKIYVTLDNHKAYRWGGSSYVEISASLVIGTTAGTAYDGASGQTNANNIALKQPILVDSATSGILIDGSNNIDIDLTRTTAETTFDDNELMLIQKTNGNLCRLTKQQLKSSINTNTEYNNGANITIDGSNDINLNSDISTNSIETKTNFVLRTQTTNNADYLNNIIYQNTGNFYNIALTRRYNSISNRSNFCIQTGGSSVLDNLPIRLCVTNAGKVNIGSDQNKTHDFNVEGTSNFENEITGTNINITGNYKKNGNIIPESILANNGLNLTSGVLKIDINDCASQSTPGADDIFIYQLNTGGTSKKIKLSELITAINTDTTYLLGNNLSFDDTTSPHTINLATTLTNMVKIVGTSDLTLQAQNEIIFLSGFDGSGGGDDIIWKTNRGSGLVQMMKLDGATNILTLEGIMDITGDYKKNGNIIPETILANNGLNLSGAGVLKIDIASCVGKSTITSTDLFILQIADGTSKKMTGAELLVATAGTDTTYTNGTNITIDSNNAINLNSTITGNITFSNNVTISGDLFGEIHPYVTTSQVDYDQPIVCYQASGVVPLLPNQVSLIVPKTNIITVNSSTGLLKSKSIEITGSLSATTTISSTTSMTTGILYVTTINSTTTNSTTINAGGNIDCMSLTGGTNNASSNFHLDCINANGEMFLNYTYNNNLRMGNVASSSLTGGGRFTIFSNQTMPLRLHNNSSSTFTTGFTASIQQDSNFDGAKMIHGFYKNLSTTKYTHTIGLSSNTSGGDSPLWLNCYHGDTVDWSTSNYKFCPVGGDTITRRMFSGCRPGMGLTVGLSNSAKINCGRSTSYDIGVRLSGWNGGAVEASHHIIQASTNLHIDASTAGDIYLNYYGQNTNSRKCRVYGFVDGSDRRIKNNFIPIDDDKLLNQIENLELTTYNFKDPRFKSNKNTLGFIADSLENQSYFENFMEISNYNIPFDVEKQIELDYILKDKIITVSNYTLDLNKEYYYYAYKEDGNFLTIQNKPLSENSFEYLFDDEFIKLVVIGTKQDNMKNIKSTKLVAPCYAGVQALIKKNKILEQRVSDLELKLNLVDELELKLNLIYEKLNISYI